MVIAPILRTINRGISTGIGLAGEKYQDRKDRKTALAEQKEKNVDVQVRELVGPTVSGAEITDDDTIWALDEAAGPPNSEKVQPVSRPEAEGTVSDLVHNVTASNEAEGHTTEARAAKLPHPIIIPQRRPGTKARGWTRVYPPDLEALGVEQDTFLRFLQNFEDAQQASPWLKALYVASNAVGLVPGHITMAVSISVSVAAGTAIELQSRYKANAFLDQMNRDLFMPLGLYAMILLCKDTLSKPGEVEFGIDSVNMETAKQISKWGLPTEAEDDALEQSTNLKLLRPIRLASGRTNVDAMPLEVAALIYPGLEDMVERPQIQRDECFKDRLMRNKAFVADYFDRRARAEYAGNNPDSALTKVAGDVPEFRNRFADPNHPCNNGHLLSLVTGGKYVSQPRGRRNMLREVGEDGKLKPKVKQEHKIRGPISLMTHPIRKALTPNILYLTIVNLPSDEEITAARQALGIHRKSSKDMLAEHAQAGA